MGAWPLPTGDSLVVPSRAQAQVYLLGPCESIIHGRALMDTQTVTTQEAPDRQLLRPYSG
jgi:hypothetical protein